MRETDLYEPVKKWLEQQGYKVYSEVTYGYSEKRADVVGLAPNVSVIIELKQSLSLELLEQAMYWAQNKSANYVYIAIPWKKENQKPYIRSKLVNYICNTFGIGIIFVRKTKMLEKIYLGEEGDFVVDSEVPYKRAKYHRTDKEYDIRSFIEKYKYEYEKNDLKGGHVGGGYVTHYKVTINRVKEFLKGVREGNIFKLYWDKEGKEVDFTAKDGWVDIDTILDYCETHYASPKPSLSKALREFEHDWCEYKLIGRKPHFRYKQ